jgi:hypothetical protein
MVATSRDALAAAIGAPLEGQRDVVVSKLLRGARFGEIGESPGVSAEAGMMRFVRALESLRADLEERGFGAMTVRDREVLELLHDKPELLAIADAVAETQTRGRARPRIRRPASASSGRRRRGGHGGCSRSARAPAWARLERCRSGAGDGRGRACAAPGRGGAAGRGDRQPDDGAARCEPTPR